MSNAAQKRAADEVDFYYFDPVLEAIAQGNEEVATAFGRHNHWGLWDEPARATGGVDDFAAAAENLTRRLTDAAGVRFGQKLLDVGCGFGGTIASLNERLQGLNMTGLNIDPRQLARAATMIQPAAGNAIQWVKGTASKLPFADRTFDTVMAVECIFHFPSRQEFFAEAARVLKPGGRLVLSDVMTAAPLALVLPRYVKRHEPEMTAIWGNLKIYCTRGQYRGLAAANGFGAPEFADVTRNIMPTYEFCMAKIPGWHGPDVAKVAIPAFRGLRRLCRLRALRYELVAFTRA